MRIPSKIVPIMAAFALAYLCLLPPSASASPRLVPLNEMEVDEFYMYLASNPSDIKDGYRYSKLERAEDMPPGPVTEQMPNRYCCWFGKNVLVVFYCDTSYRVMGLSVIVDSSTGDDTAQEYQVRCLANTFLGIGMTEDEVQKLLTGEWGKPRVAWCEAQKRWMCYKESYLDDEQKVASYMLFAQRS